jgi:hypothetical protein
MRSARVLVTTALAALLVPAVGGARARTAAADLESAKKLFLENVKKPDWKSRRTAYGALSDHDGTVAAKTILDSVQGEENVVVVATAVEALRRFASIGARTVLLDALRKGRPTERLHAAYALAYNLAPEVDAALIEVAAGTGPAAGQAVLSLGTPRRGAGAFPALVRALASDAAPVRTAAARALGNLEAKEAVKPLVERLKVEKGRPRAAVVAALEAITKKRLGDSPKKWAAVAAGEDEAAVEEKPALPPTFFGIPVVGERVVFVLDRSLLMADPHPLQGPEHRERLEALCTPPDGDRIPYRRLKSKLQLASAHLLHAVEGLPSGSKFEVILMSAEVAGVFEKKWVSPGTAARKTLSDALSALEVNDGINLHDALQAALDLGGVADDKAWRAGPDEVFLVTNNMPTAGEVADADLVALGIGVKARLRNVVVNVVGIGNHPFHMAKALAQRTGGSYFDLSK